MNHAESLQLLLPEIPKLRSWRKTGRILVFTSGLFSAILMFFFSGPLSADSLSQDLVAPVPIKVSDVFLRVRDEAILPALERGQLKQLAAEPGDAVNPGTTVALLDDVEASLNLELAKIELRIAEKEHQDSVAVPIQRAALEEGRMLLTQARLESEVAKATASSEIGIKQAISDGEFSRQELDRAEAARKEFSSSVSEQQLAKLTLTRDQHLLALELARHQQAVETLRSRSKESLVAQQEIAVSRLEHTLSRSEGEFATEELKITSLQKQVAIAEERLERRKIRAPFSGVVIEKTRNTGEWVEAGSPVLKIIRLDLLHVEGYADAKLITPEFRGRKVLVSCEGPKGPMQTEGRIVFVSPQIDPVSKQVQIRAEISNPDQTFRPGQAADMTILP